MLEADSMRHCGNCAHSREIRLDGQLEFHCPIQADGAPDGFVRLAIVEPGRRCGEYWRDDEKFRREYGFYPDDPAGYDRNPHPALSVPARPHPPDARRRAG